MTRTYIKRYEFKSFIIISGIGIKLQYIELLHKHAKLDTNVVDINTGIKLIKIHNQTVSISLTLLNINNSLRY